MEDVCLELERERTAHGAVARKRDRMLSLQDQTTRFLLTAVQTMDKQQAAVTAPEMERHRSMLEELLAKFFAFQQALKFKGGEGGRDGGQQHLDAPPEVLALPPSDSQRLLAQPGSGELGELSLPPLGKPKPGRDGGGGPAGLLAQLDRGELGFGGGSELAATGPGSPSPTGRQTGSLFSNSRYST